MGNHLHLFATDILFLRQPTNQPSQPSPTIHSYSNLGYIWVPTSVYYMYTCVIPTVLPTKERLHACNSLVWVTVPHYKWVFPPSFFLWVILFPCFLSCLPNKFHFCSPFFPFLQIQFFLLPVFLVNFLILSFSVAVSLLLSLTKGWRKNAPEWHPIKPSAVKT